MPKNLRELPKLRDSISFVYIEHSVIEKDNSSIAAISKDGRIPIPVSSVTCLMLGPGTSVTHAAIHAICENGCAVIWCGESMSPYYGYGSGETRSSKNLLLQAKHCMDPELHLEVVRKMYGLRFKDLPNYSLDLVQLRGLEGNRMQVLYQELALKYGVKWNGRNYKGTDFKSSSYINQALSIANHLLYGVCHAAIISLGYSPGLGFIHTGQLLSFVFDIADLYKADTTLPAAFKAVSSFQSDPTQSLYRLVRSECRKHFFERKVLKSIPADLAFLFSTCEPEVDVKCIYGGELWDGDGITILGGKNFGKGGLNQ